MNTSVQKPGGTYWSGATSEAAEANTHAGWKTTAAAEDIIERYRTTAVPLIDHTIVPELANARNIIENVESQRDKGVSCSEDLKLTYTPVPGTSEKLIEENTKLVETRQAELTKSANAWFSGCQQVAQLVATARKELDTVYDGATGTFDINKALAATAPPATPNSTVKPNGIVGGLEHLAAPDPNGEPGATKAAGAAGVETPGNFYKDWYPKAVDVGDKNVDPSKLGGVGAVPGVRDVTDKTTPQRMSPTLKPQDVPAFKEMTREVLQRQGVPADQIEARVNKAVEQAQTPHFLPDAPSASPSEHVSRDFGEQWNKFFANASDGGSKAGDAILDEGKKLTGLAGPGAPGVAEAWGALAKDTAKGLWDYTTMTPQERLEMLGNEAQRIADNPGGYLGEKLVQGAAGAATGAVGGEAVAGLRGLVGDLAHAPHVETPGGAGHAGGDAPGHHGPPTPTVEHPTPVTDHPAPVGGLDHPAPNAGGWNHSIEHYSPQAPQLAADLNSAFTNGHATPDLAGQVADHSTHHAPGISSTANPDRVVLGKWDGQDGGYIGEAKTNGGIYFDTGKETWDAVGNGLSKTDANRLGWQVNEQFLRQQMENRVGRIDYVLDSQYSSIEEVLMKRQGSFSALEIEFLADNAAKYGYERVGNSWIKVGR
ncbi:endonuclease [Mycobacteroides abscessus]